MILNSIVRCCHSFTWTKNSTVPHIGKLQKTVKAAQIQKSRRVRRTKNRWVYFYSFIQCYTLLDYHISKHIVWLVVVIPFTAKEILQISYLHFKEVISNFAFRELSDWSRHHVMQHEHFLIFPRFEPGQNFEPTFLVARLILRIFDWPDLLYFPLLTQIQSNT